MVISFNPSIKTNNFFRSIRDKDLEKESSKNLARNLITYQDYYTRFFTSIQDEKLGRYVKTIILPAWDAYKKSLLNEKNASEFIKVNDFILNQLVSVAKTVKENYKSFPEEPKLSQVLEQLIREIKQKQNQTLIEESKRTGVTEKQLSRMWLARERPRSILDVSKRIFLRSKYLTSQTLFSNNYAIVLKNDYENLTDDQIKKEVDETWDQILSSAELLSQGKEQIRDEIVKKFVQYLTKDQMLFNDAKNEIKSEFKLVENFEDAAFKEFNISDFKPIENFDISIEDVLEDWNNKDIIAANIDSIPNENDKNQIGILLFEIAKLYKYFEVNSEDAQIKEELETRIKTLMPLLNKYINNIEAVQEIYSGLLVITKTLETNIFQDNSFREGSSPISKDENTLTVLNDPTLTKPEEKPEEKMEGKVPQQAKKQYNKTYTSTDHGRANQQAAAERHRTRPEIQEKTKDRVKQFRSEHGDWDTFLNSFRKWFDRNVNKFLEIANDDNYKLKAKVLNEAIFSKLNESMDAFYNSVFSLSPEERSKKILVLSRNIKDYFDLVKYQIKNSNSKYKKELEELVEYFKIECLKLIDNRKTGSVNLKSNSEDRFKLFELLDF